MKEFLKTQKLVNDKKKKLTERKCELQELDVFEESSAKKSKITVSGNDITVNHSHIQNQTQ